ncbi:MAG: protein-glutamate O-methyltransferase CheR [Gammaproteobacteria bacterium]|nr:protein-glutamate O-methyltransferase CheR [Gammaproteobacteria bacterium]MDH5800515.1 protein-glutamate O-methyltransferase CheR [Gammaproteobacteria bacterium]
MQPAKNNFNKDSNQAPTLKSADYATFCSYLERESGITLGANKEYLVSSRLNSIMSQNGIRCFSELVPKMQSSKFFRQLVLDAMTTNETSWFRDKYPYEVLYEKLLAEFGKQKKREIRIWSAACSTGQEPYSISMIVSEFLSRNPGTLSSTSVRILGTDLSSSVVKQAQNAEYESLALIRGLSDERRQRFFKSTGTKSQVIEEVRSRVSFRELNLKDSYLLLGKFDIIFCRNVLIYFTPELKVDIVNRMTQALNPGGFLILGGAESISGLTERFELVRWKNGLIYQLK